MEGAFWQITNLSLFETIYRNLVGNAQNDAKSAHPALSNR